MKSEQEFINSAQEWLRQAVGGEVGAVDPDVDLLEAGWLDSLLTIAFLAFLEDQRGAPLPITAATGIAVEDFATIRRAYRLVAAAER